MAERLTTNQEVPGSTPGWIDIFCGERFRRSLWLFANKGIERKSRTIAADKQRVGLLEWKEDDLQCDGEDQP